MMACQRPTKPEGSESSKNPVRARSADRVSSCREPVKVYFNVRRRGAPRWTAYPFPAGAKPAIKRGYEMTGPHANLVIALLAATGGR